MGRDDGDAASHCFIARKSTTPSIGTFRAQPYRCAYGFEAARLQVRYLKANPLNASDRKMHNSDAFELSDLKSNLVW